MFGWNSLSQEEKSARDALRSGDPKKAFAALRPLLEYPGKLSSEKLWSSAWRNFADIADRIAGPELSDLSRAAARTPKDPRVLYEFGYGLVEHNLHGPAATVLTRAFELAPTAEPVLTELVCALEGIGLNERACAVLEESGMAGGSFLPRYLLAFNKLMCGRIADSTTWLEGLAELAPSDSAQSESFQFMESALRDMHHRAGGLKGHAALDAADLRGWTYVVNNCLLLHLSEYGTDEGMNGRYAYLQESPELLAEGIHRLSRVLGAAKAVPLRIHALPDRDSEILARVAAATLNCDLLEWSPDHRNEPGVFACFDLANVEVDTAASLSIRHPGQVLWCHACTWTQNFPLAPDIITYFHQYTTPPWRERLKVDVDTKQLTKEPALSGTCEEVATRVCGMLPATSDMSDLETLLDFAGRTGLSAEWLNGSGQQKRSIFRMDSPVKSSRFY